MRSEIWVDFNEIDEHRRTLTTRRMAASDVDLQVGARVLAGDHEGNRCSGEIVDLRPGGIVEIALDLGTFTQVDEIAPQGDTPRRKSS